MTEKKKEEKLFPHVVTLDEPISVDGTSYSTITFRQPRGRDWRRWHKEGNEERRLMGFLSDIGQVPEAVIDELPFEAHAEVVNVARLFFAIYQPEKSGLLNFAASLPLSSDGQSGTVKS
ncbi:phage tail assembly protein [Taklimakanibacter albus]|uniref:Phage tail assembly protein n=1 Tax=Taklimakanibacter albus TaxID=2800327 RepID=A0ACC5R6Q2_9HYPH|nr:phage tail assembly protein [Aestuariivirga sp. YIM B02566]MBK1868247.1 phage tail assembly protein [Aestuariivirga sp. YIM B02566]